MLASLISVNDAQDDDSLRVAISSEAGMNDGSALPLLMLALLLFNGESLSVAMLGHWGAVEVLWAIGGGLIIGFVLGQLIGLLATRLRNANGDVAPNDFLALALIALSYSLVSGWVPPASWLPSPPGWDYAVLRWVYSVAISRTISLTTSACCPLKHW